MTFPFQNPDLSIEERLDDLLPRLTLEEKVARMMHDSAPIERLGIPAFNWWNECSHGVARAGAATVYPHAIGLAAMFDAPFLCEVGAVVAEEARAKHHEAIRLGERGIYQGLTFWTPNINIVRDPRWGRGMETFGEDPHLTGALAVAYIRGLEGEHPKYLKTAACAKHYAVHSGPEPKRHEFDARVDARDLHETYLPAFRACVTEARVTGIMGAYNRMNGEPCCAHPYLNVELLQRAWKFDGYYVSDVGAIVDIWKWHKFVATQPEACAVAVHNGCDLNGGGEYVPSLVEAVRAGLIAESEVDVSVRRLFKILMRLGHLDPPERVPFASVPHSVVECDTHLAHAREAARRSLVLLKNDGVLPLDRSAIQRIAVVGPNSVCGRAMLGNYYGMPSDWDTIYEAIQKHAGEDIHVEVEPGCMHAPVTWNLQPVPARALRVDATGDEQGLRAEYFAGPALKGEAVVRRIDGNISLTPTPGAPAPLSAGNFSARWSGYVVVPRDGLFRIGVSADANIRLYLEDKLVAEKITVHGDEIKTLTRVGRAWERIPVRVEYENTSRNPYAFLLWIPPDDPESDWVGDAVREAREADVVIACLGLSGDLEGEEGDSGGVPGFVGGDRTTLDLPGRQMELLDALCDTGKPVVVVTMSGSAINLSRAHERCGAILHAWYPGGQGGPAIAEALFGDSNPGGRLPVTFYRSAGDLPPFEEYAMEGRTYRFFRGGPLYPFGYGLSYTRFCYADLRLAPQTVPTDAESIAVSVKVTNAGERMGDEAVQLYVQHLDAAHRVPLRALQGFTRVRLAAGETREVKFTLNSRSLSQVLPDGRRVVAPGRILIAVGGRQPGVPVPDSSTTDVLTAELRLAGSIKELEP